MGEPHWLYSRGINFREGWRGYLFQGRFASYPMDDGHLMAAIRYVSNNLDPFPIKSAQTDRIRKGLTLADDHSYPDQIATQSDSIWSRNGLVAAGMVAQAEEWRWSSAASHIAGKRVKGDLRQPDKLPLIPRTPASSACLITSGPIGPSRRDSLNRSGKAGR